VRAKPDAAVSAPCAWQEVESGDVGLQSFNLRNMPERIAAVGDVWKDLTRRGRSLTRPIARLRKLTEPK
jgi:bifunctional non-homologous end joining protein LigD